MISNLHFQKVTKKLQKPNQKEQKSPSTDDAPPQTEVNKSKEEKLSKTAG